MFNTPILKGDSKSNNTQIYGGQSDMKSFLKLKKKLVCIENVAYSAEMLHPCLLSHFSQEAVMSGKLIHHPRGSDHAPWKK